MRLIRRSATAVAGVAAVLALSACAAQSVADSTYRGDPQSLEMPPEQLVAVFAAGDGSVDVTTWGSSSCPAVATHFSIDDYVLNVTFAPANEDACTDDLSPTTHVFDAETVGETVPDAAHITFSETGEVIDVTVARG